jgi:glycosyltransferase involved in cell wall biosynthesis
MAQTDAVGEGAAAVTTALQDHPRTAILSQSDRTWQIEAALETTSVPYEVDPADPWEHDVLVIETPDREMMRHVVRGRNEGTTVVFRMRGDPYWGISHWYDHPVPPVRWGKQWLALKQLEWVDACFALAPHQKETYRRRTGNPTRQVKLSRHVDHWPTADHTDEKLQLLTLTNCMYPAKIKPLIEYAETVNDVLNDTGGYWTIGGDGRYADRLAEAVEPYEHIWYPGYVDAHEHLDRANCLLHLSYMDSFAGAVLEGMASGLPVISTSHPAFTELPTDPIDGSANQLRSLLRGYVDPQRRAARGERNLAVADERYSHERVGERWVDLLHWADDL